MNADIKAELAVCKERLANYEHIEKELDNAIVGVAQGEEGQGDIGNLLLQTIHSAPTASKRRIQQSLLLAKRLQAKQTENERIQKELAESQKKIMDLTEEMRL